MLMAAAADAHTDSAHSAGSTISPPPWHPAVPVPVPIHHQHQAAVLYDPDLTTPSPSPSPPQRNQHQKQLRPAAARRASSRRRPRPSRKVPTTYITADPTSFRRMVHQVTGADDLLPPLAPPPPPHEASSLCRPAPYRAAARGALPTLDTSALLLGIGGSGSARRTTGPAASVRPAAAEVDVGAGGGGVSVGLGGAGYSSSDCGGAGFPTLESWDALLY
ncbi:calmodulin-binding protein 25-like [Miscanthus floridulus]|uniref:calmodulin-binding protein 25-like n=1 Tax=Miscanthus floridulus TaxID=154761 RepID=UPI00345A44CA